MEVSRNSSYADGIKMQKVSLDPEFLLGDEQFTRGKCTHTNWLKDPPRSPPKWDTILLVDPDRRKEMAAHI